MVLPPSSQIGANQMRVITRGSLATDPAEPDDDRTWEKYLRANDEITVWAARIDEPFQLDDDLQAFASGWIVGTRRADYIAADDDRFDHNYFRL